MAKPVIPVFKKASEAARWIAATLTDGNWTQFSRAVDAEGYSLACNYDDPRAAKFCAMGWIEMADQGHEAVIIDRFEACIEPKTVIQWNDTPHRTVEDVKSAFTKTAEALEFNGQ
jgi:hypothetical protein